MADHLGRSTSARVRSGAAVRRSQANRRQSRVGGPSSRCHQEQFATPSLSAARLHLAQVSVATAVRSTYSFVSKSRFRRRMNRASDVAKIIGAPLERVDVCYVRTMPSSFKAVWPESAGGESIRHQNSLRRMSERRGRERNKGR